MNHEDVIKYIKSHLKNMLDEKIKSMEQSIRNNLKKQYKLKNPILHEYCIINSIEEFNRLLETENKEYMNEIGEIDEYKLTLDKNYFNGYIHISDDIKIIPIRIENNINQLDEDPEDKDLIMDTNDKIKIIIIIVAIYYMKSKATFNNQPR